MAVSEATQQILYSFLYGMLFDVLLLGYLFQEFSSLEKFDYHVDGVGGLMDFIEIHMEGSFTESSHH